MGIKRLQNYFVHNHYTTETNLSDAAEDWRRKGGNSVLVVDCFNILNFIAHDCDTSCCGGEYPLYEARLEKFVKAFRDISIELAFCFDGPVDMSRMNIWQNRGNTKMISLKRAFEEVPHILVKDFEEEVFPFMIVHLANDTLKPKCQVFQTKLDPDKEMAQYVVENKCLGIMSDDTDFLVFDGIPHVFSCKNIVSDICNCEKRNGHQFDPKQLRCTEFLREQFANSVGLQLPAFPIFACMAGNDFVEFDEAMDVLKRRFGKTSFPAVIKDIVREANELYNHTRGNPERVASYLAACYFQHAKFKKPMLDSLIGYDLQHKPVNPPPLPTTHWDNLLESLLKVGRLSHGVKCIVVHSTYTQSARFEDQNRPCGEVLADLRRRFYSILLHEKSRETEFVREFVATRPGCFNITCLVRTEKVEVDHPGLWALLTAGDEFNEQRWRLVWWALCSTSSIDYKKIANLRNLPDELKIVGLTTFYLFRVKEEIDKHEVSIIMLMAAVLTLYTVDMLEAISMREKYTSRRAISVSTLYQECYAKMSFLTKDICGLKIKSKLSKFYSGHLFHWLFGFKDIGELYPKLASKVWDKFFVLNDALEKSL